MRWLAAPLVITLLATCGPRVNGAIAEACVDGGRDSATAARCNCIGQVASQMLSGGDQRRLISFFDDPERANDIKIDDSRAADAFWARYRAFTAQAERSCRR